MANRSLFLSTLLISVSAVLWFALLVEGRAAAQACSQLGAKCDFHSHPIDHSSQTSSRSNDPKRSNPQVLFDQQRSPVYDERDYRRLAKEFNSEGITAFENKDYIGAVHFYRMALHQNPQNDAIHANLLAAEAFHAAEVGAYDQAIDRMHSAMQWDDYYRSSYWMKWYTKLMTRRACERSGRCSYKKGEAVGYLIDQCIERPANGDGLCW